MITLELGYIDLVRKTSERIVKTKLILIPLQDGPMMYWTFPTSLVGTSSGITVNVSMSGPGYVSAHEITYDYDNGKVNVPSEASNRLLEQLNAIIDSRTR